MDLNKYDGRCVRIITTSGEVFEGVVSYDDREYAFHEYGHDEEALRLTPILFYRNEKSQIIDLFTETKYKYFLEDDIDTIFP